ncbi:hypothetical protein [Sphingomonas sp. Leaf10]|uniref:hypothetical protein n=1 Tax=Sphingomonas sp. Leaf10 TaxID=1735676 RepID=UPI000700AA3D|nr:hypothetical protein [Sphingomonas sp. Leaf10]KQM36447.1 hypothetical protein ASE59_05240 [Sphingomonas sp. Leaf10]
MSNDDAAKVLFAETRNWREDPSEPEQVRIARRVLARAIRASDGKGFAPGDEPTVAELGNPTTFAIWQDCFSATAEAWAPAESEKADLGYVVSQLPPQDNAAYLKAAPKLNGATPASAHGPFRFATGGGAYSVYVFDGVEGVGPGLFPPRSAPVAGPGGSSRFRHAWPAALAILFCVALLSGVAYDAYCRGVSATATAIRPSGLAQRLTRVIADVDPRLSDEARRIAEDVVSEAKLVPVDQAAWWQSVKANTGIPARTAATAAEIDTKAAAAKASTVSRVEALAPRNLGAGVLDDMKKRAGDAVDHAFRNDPIAIRPVVSLGGPWLFAVGSLVVIAGVVGMGFWGSVLGALIDSRNRLSLSRLQLMAWTILVLSLFGITSPFLIGASEGAVSLPQYPWEIWALLGISIGTPPLSGLILVSKSGQAPQPNAERSIRDDPDATNVGRVEVNLDPNGWSFLDFFRGEEVSNRDEIDISRFQYFVITIILLMVFIGLIGTELWSLQAGQDWAIWAKTKSYPTLNETFIGLLALSHGGYLGMKLLAKPDVKPGA